MFTSLSTRHRFCNGPLLVLVVTLLLTLAACDSGGSEPRPGDVAGIYTFEQLTFDITAPGFPDVNVLDTLAMGARQAPELVLRSSGLFTLQYQFKGDDDDVVTGGTFTVTENRVRLTADEADSPFLNEILLPSELALRREEGDVLTTATTRTVNLEQFNPQQYPGLESVGGTLRIRLVED